MKRIVFLSLFIATSALSQSGNLSNSNLNGQGNGVSNGVGSGVNLTFTYTTDCLLCFSWGTSKKTQWHPPLLYPF